MLWTIPTLMTLTRIVAIPFILLVFYMPISMEMKNLCATIMFIVFALTDWLDGYAARKLGMINHLGIILDPLADKVLMVVVFIMLKNF